MSTGKILWILGSSVIAIHAAHTEGLSFYLVFFGNVAAVIGGYMHGYFAARRQESE